VLPRSRDVLPGDAWPDQFDRQRTWNASYRAPPADALFGHRITALRFSGLLHAEPIHLALFGSAVLICLRFVLAARLPLSFDEAYYWLWSKHLASGYFEHPAAIAFGIRLGTFLCGDTEFGVRLIPLLASVTASWAVWRSATIVLSDERAGAIAALLFNATLMVAAEGMGATPDSLLIAAAALLLLAIAELERSGDGRWWIAVGGAAGMAIAAKYTGFFLCISIAIWLVVSRLRHRGQGTIWLRTFWPYAGAAVALAMFAPTLYWNATHDFVSFRFQFGRVAAGHPGWLNLLQFIGGQIGLLSPGILCLAGIGFYRTVRAVQPGRALAFAATVLWPPVIYFAQHSLHDRVQGNWPCFVYPALALLAAKAYSEIPSSANPLRTLRFARATAIPAACIILSFAYLQAFSGALPIGRPDPIARMMGVGFRPVADKIAAQAAKTGARAIVTTNYAVTSWLRFYEHSRLPVIQIADDCRFVSSPRAPGNALTGKLLYVTQNSRRELPDVSAHFSNVTFSARIARSRAGRTVDAFDVFTIAGFRGPAIGRIP
jgi:hypothetical protein